MSNPITKCQIGLTDHAAAILDRLATEHSCNRSELVEWLLLCQIYNPGEAEAMFALRRGRGRVWLLPEASELPPEG